MLTIECTERDWDVSQITAALVIPAQRQYVGELTLDEPNTGRQTFHGDVELQELDQEKDVLVFTEWYSETDQRGETFAVDVADIRRISFY